MSISQRRASLLDAFAEVLIEKKVQPEAIERRLDTPRWRWLWWSANFVSYGLIQLLVEFGNIQCLYEETL